MTLALENQMEIGSCILGGIISADIAKKKGRSPVRWGALGFFIIGPVVFLLINIVVVVTAGFMTSFYE